MNYKKYHFSRITIGEVEKMWGIGTPEDLDSFLAENKDLIV